MSLQEERVLKGQCPQCGKEAAPYRLCYDCRQERRINRMLKRGVRHGVLKFMGNPNRLTKNTLVWKGDKFDDPDASGQWGKWSTPVVLPESDGRARPRLRGISVDVEATLMKVIEFIGRPCTIDEISAAWGKLRSRRVDPLTSDLGTIIKAADRRERRAMKRAAIAAHQQA